MQIAHYIILYKHFIVSFCTREHDECQAVLSKCMELNFNILEITHC